MRFEDLIAPLDRDEFMRRYRDGVCFVIRGSRDKFSSLVSLDDIERRLNDGCNLNSPINLIAEDGHRYPPVSREAAWSPLATDKREVLDRVRSGHSFMMTNLSQLTPRIASLIDSLEEALAEDELRGDLHLYVSTRRESSAYNAHRDYPQHKIYIQVIGSTEWRVFHHDPDLAGEVRAVSREDEAGLLEEAGCFTLDPGDVFYMPPAVFHKVRNLSGPRVSLSIPLVPAAGKARMDRTYIPFRQLFEEGLQDASGESDAA